MQTGTAVGGGGNNEESHLKLQLQRTTSVGVVGSSSISGMERSVSWDEDIQSIECDIMAQIKRDTNKVLSRWSNSRNREDRLLEAQNKHN